ncbi:MAG: hypothetical protein ACI3YK_07510 [Eubacteriales bacterium]
MSDKRFQRLLLIIVAIGVAATVALLIYTVYLYMNCSILTLIASGR